MKNIRKLALTAMIALAGCRGPEAYRKGVNVNSEEYSDLIKNKGITNSFHNSKSFDVKSFYSGESESIRYSVWDTQNPKEIVLYLNGLESQGGWFSKCADDLSEKGIKTYSLDRRGSGLNSKISGNYESWINDVQRLSLNIRKEHPDSDINLVSLCFGARVATAQAIKNPDSVDSLVYISPGLDTKVDLNCFEKFLVGLSPLGVNIPISSPIKDIKMFTKNLEGLEYITNDVLRTVSPNSQDFYQGFLLGKFDKKNLSKINDPSLVFLAGKDEISDIKKSSETFLNLKIPAKLIVYPKSKHTLFFDDKDKFINDLIKFIDEN